jgi:MFS family permease
LHFPRKSNGAILAGVAGISDRVGESVSALREVYRNPGLRWVQLAYAGAAVGTYAYAVALGVYAYREGGATAVGIVMAVRLGVAATVAPFAASAADAFRRERVMLWSDLGRALAVGLAAAAVALEAASLIVYALAVCTSIIGTVFRPAESALLPSLARTPEELTAANVSSSTFDSVGSFVGPAIAALLLSVSSTWIVFGLVAATFAWSASCVRRVHGPDQAAAVSLDEQHHGFAAGLRAIRAEPRLRLLIGLYGAQCLVAGALGVLVIVIALDLLDIGNAGVGLLEAASGVGSIVGAGVALALVGRGRLAGDFALGIVLWGAPLVLIGAVPVTLVAVLALAVVGVGNTLVDISAMTLLQRTAPPAVAARVFGVLESVIVGGLALGALLAPALVAVLGTRGALLVVGSFLPLLAALRWRSLARIDDGARVPEDRLDAVESVPFLAILPVQSRELLASQLTSVAVPAQTLLFARGDHGDRFYILVDGELEIELPGEVKVETAPASVGEIALLRDVPRTATVRARADASLFALDRETFLDAVLGHARSKSSAEAVAVARVGTA